MGLWAALSAVRFATPPGDNVEQLVWAQQLAWGYPKHPPLPTWILVAAAQRLPLTDGLTYALAAGCIGTALLIMWRVSGRLMGARAALVALLLSTCLVYYTFRAGFYNHNTVLLPFVAASYAAFVRVAESGSRRAWLALGVSLGAGALVKYQIALFALSYAAWFIVSGALRARHNRQGALICLLAAAGVAAPQLWWQWTAGLPALGYATTMVLADDPAWRRPIVALGFAGQQLARIAPALLAYAVAITWTRRRPAASSGDGDAGQARGRQVDAFVFAALFPWAVVLGMAGLLGSRLQNHWGTTLVLPLLPTLVLYCERRGMRARLKAVVGAVAGCHILSAVVALAQCTTPMVNRSPTAARDHLTFPSAAFANAANSYWRSVSDQPLRVVVGPQWEAGAVALRMDERPRVLSTEERITWTVRDWRTARDCGALFVWNAAVLAHDAIQEDFDIRPTDVRVVQVSRRDRPDKPLAGLKLAVMLPEAPQRCGKQ